MYARAFLKDRELKNEHGDMEQSPPNWGSSWDVLRSSYPQLEALLAAEEG
jgi:hypothetical protein